MTSQGSLCYSVVLCPGCVGLAHCLSSTQLAPAGTLRNGGSQLASLGGGISGEFREGIAKGKWTTQGMK